MLVMANPLYFQRLYVCLEACKNGFKKACRPIIRVDGCHLKGAFGGQLLAAVGIDANDNMYPIAYAVVESEDKETWCWFLQLLIEDLGPVEMHGWNFISDQQKGLDEAFKIVVPEADHGEVSKQNSRQGNKTFRTTSAIPTPCSNIQAAENSNMPSASTNAWQGLYCNPHETSYVQVPHQPTITRVSCGTFTTIPRHSNSSRVTTSNSRVNVPQQKVGTSTRKFGTSTTTTRKKSSTTSASTSMFGLASATSSNLGQGFVPILRPPGMTSR